MPEKITTYGARFYRTAIALANDIGNLLALGNMSFSRGDVETSTHSDDWKTFIPGQWDGGDIPIRVAFDPQDTQHISLWTNDGQSAPTQALGTWIATVPSKADGTKKMSITFTGYVKSFEFEEFPVEGKQVVALVFKVSGTPVIDADESTVPA